LQSSFQVKKDSFRHPYCFQNQLTQKRSSISKHPHPRAIIIPTFRLPAMVVRHQIALWVWHHQGHTPIGATNPCHPLR
jgi:hypothetical protein